MKAPYTKCGKCGNTVWQRGRYGQISYPYHRPAQPNSPAQRFVRANFGAVSARWRALREDQRQVWLRQARNKKTRRRLGQQFRLGGYNYFVKLNVALVNRGQPQVDLPPIDYPLAALSLPLLTHRLLLPAGEFLTGCPQSPSGTAGQAPPPSG